MLCKFFGYAPLGARFLHNKYLLTYLLNFIFFSSGNVTCMEREMITNPKNSMVVLGSLTDFDGSITNPYSCRVLRTTIIRKTVLVLVHIDRWIYDPTGPDMEDSGLVMVWSLTL